MKLDLSVIIPTYGRPQELDRTLKGLAEQTRKPEQVIIVLRPDDVVSAEIVARWSGRLALESCSVTVPGVVQALNMGLDHARGDIITITDDDTFAPPDWLARIETHFRKDHTLGGLGGRDIVHVGADVLKEDFSPVGVILPYGRIVGNHHTGRGLSREVDHLKGVNMSWRMNAIIGHRFDTGMRGSGAQVYFELAFSLDVKRRGWKLVYDPALYVEHFPAQRFDSDKRDKRNLEAAENASFNLYFALRRYMQPGLHKSLALAWVHYFGAFGHPGVFRGLQYRLQGNKQAQELRTVTARAWKDAKREPYQVPAYPSSESPIVLSIIIPTRNRRDVLGRLLASIGSQELKNVEIIIIDDASERPISVTEVSSYLPSSGPERIQVVWQPNPVGACAARNSGVAIARGRYVLFVDDDIEFVGEDLFTRLVAFADANPRVGVVALAELYPNGEWGFNVTPEGPIVEVARFHGCGALFRKECFYEANGFFEPLGYYYEEFELSMRVIDAGWHIVFNPDMQIIHYRDTRGRNKRGIVRLISRNAGLTAILRFPLWLVPFALIAQTFRLALLSWTKAPFDPWGPFAVAAAVLRRLPSTMRNRHKLHLNALLRYRVLAAVPKAWRSHVLG